MEIERQGTKQQVLCVVAGQTIWCDIQKQWIRSNRQESSHWLCLWQDYSCMWSTFGRQDQLRVEHSDETGPHLEGWDFAMGERNTGCPRYHLLLKAEDTVRKIREARAHAECRGASTD